MSAGAKFRELLKKHRYVVTPGITTPLHAMIVERAGYEFVYVGGHDVSVTLLGLPDVGLVSETEMVTNARHIARSVSLPVIADADTGYGNAINVIHTVRDFEAAGVAGIHIEDQVAPKRCGLEAGTVLIPVEEAVGKLKAALDARADEDFVIIGRTDAVGAAGSGLDEAIHRAKAYAAAGCDMVFANVSSAEAEQPRLFAKAVHAEYPDLPLYFNYASSHKWHESRVTFEDLADMGYSAIHVSVAAFRTTMEAVWDYAVDMRERGAQAEFERQERMIGHPMDDVAAFEGFPEIRELEAKYLPAEDLSRMYGK